MYTEAQRVIDKNTARLNRNRVARERYYNRGVVRRMQQFYALYDPFTGQTK